MTAPPRGWRDDWADTPSPWMWPAIDAFLRDRYYRRLMKADRGRVFVRPLVDSKSYPFRCDRCCQVLDRSITMLLILGRVHFTVKLCIDCAAKEVTE